MIEAPPSLPPTSHVIDLVLDDRGFLIPHVDGKRLPGAQKVVVTNDIAVRYAEITLRVFQGDLTINGGPFLGPPK